MPVVITSHTRVPQSSSTANAPSTIRAASDGEGGSGCGGVWRGRWAPRAGLVAIQSQRTAALSAPLITACTCRTVDAAIGLHACGAPLHRTRQRRSSA
jgi:hypothetical protein